MCPMIENMLLSKRRQTKTSHLLNLCHNAFLHMQQKTKYKREERAIPHGIEYRVNLPKLMKFNFKHVIRSKCLLLMLALLIMLPTTSCSLFYTASLKEGVIIEAMVDYREVDEDEPAAAEGMVGTEATVSIEEEDRADPQPVAADLDMRAAFDELLNREFISFVTNDPISLQLYIKYPENFGITDFEVSWEGFVTGTSREEWIASFQESIQEFETFERARLTPEQRQSYDILAWQIEVGNKSLENDFSYHRTALQDSSGLHVLLPILLSNYHFNDRQDIENYLYLLSEIHIVLQDALQYEVRRTERGFPFPNRIIEDIINTCEEFLSNPEDNLLLVSFERRIFEADFLDDEEVEYYLDRNADIFFQRVIPAFEEFVEDLAELKGVGGQEELGLAHFPGGQEFYRARLQGMGTGIEPGVLLEMFTEWLEEIGNEWWQLIIEHSWLVDYESDMFSFYDPAEFMAFLGEAAAPYFPPLPAGTSYEIRRIDDSLTGFAPAFYITPQIDNYIVNAMYYDADFADDMTFMYFMLAHEGIPGHMLQFVTVYASPLHHFRKTNTRGFTINTEGWATYTELFASQFLETSDIHRRMLELDKELNLAFGGLIDIGVHYAGWTMEEMDRYLRTIGILYGVPADAFESNFEFIVSNPFRMVPYGTGLLEMRLLLEENERYQGEAFDLLAFHETFLNLGPAPFPLVREWMIGGRGMSTEFSLREWLRSFLSLFLTEPVRESY